MTDLASKSRAYVAEHTAALAEKRASHLEAMSVAVAEAVRAGEFDLDVELVEQRSADGLSTRWFFRRKGSDECEPWEGVK